MNKYTIILLLMLFATITSYSQVSGKVVNQNNEPLLNVSVLVNGTAKGIETNREGDFEIKGLKGSQTLTFSLLGYKKEVLKVQAPKINLKIILKNTNASLDEVTIDGRLNKTKVTSASLRLKTPIKQLPQNIQIVSDKVLEDQMITNILEGAIRNVSGVSPIEHWGHFARINMRGFRLPAFRNGVNIQDSWGPLSEDMFMVDKIEFVKGPSGFMMAAGEPGGFYNVVTKKPTAKKIAKISLMAGTQNTYRGAIDFGGKIGNNDRFQYRLNAMYQTAGSHRKFEEANRLGIAPSLSFKITPKTKFLTEFTYQDADSYIGSAYIFGPVSKGYASVDRNFTMIDKNYPKTEINELSFLNRLTHNFNDFWSAELQYVKIDYNQEGYSTWLDKFEDNGDATRYIGRWDAISEGNYFQAYINGKFNTGSLNHKILLGYDFTKKHYWAHDFYNSNQIIDTTKPFNIFSPHYGDFAFPTFTREKGSIKDIDGVYNYSSKINSGYIQDEISFLDDKIRLTLAGRFTNLSNQPFNKKQPISYEKFTPRIGISADVTKDITLYGLYDKSFVPASGARKDKADLIPIEGDIFEGGIKTSFLNNKVKASLSAYVITKKNITVSDPNNGANDRFVVQLGEVQSKGVEFDLQGNITNELSAILNYANTNVEITKDTNPNVIGKRITGHAKHITNGWLTYNFSRLSKLKGFGLSLGYQYQIDRSSWAWGADNKTDLPDYFRLDGAITWQNDKWRVGLNINNILNEYLYSGANYGSYLYWQSEPGTNGRISVSYNL